jgi:hypothetical protein
MDRQALYLQGLQTGYRIDEYNYTSLGLGETVIFAPSNPNRVLLFVDPNLGSSAMVWFRLQSGLLVSYFADATLPSLYYSVAQHYSIPSFEVVIVDNNPAQVFTGFGIIKQ